MKAVLLSLISILLAASRVIAAPPQPPAATLEKSKPAESDSEMAKLDRNIALNPNYPFAYVVRGSVRKTHGDLDGALADFNKAIALNPANPGFWNNRGLVKQAKHDLPGAAADFTHALQLNPNYVDAWYNRARVRKAAADLDGALADYDRTIELDPHLADAWLRRGNVKMARGDIEGAWNDFRLCDKYSDPNQRDYPRINMWIARTAKGQKTAATPALANYMARRPARFQGTWSTKIILFLIDRLDEQAFIAAATPKGNDKDQGPLCQAWYYVGVKHLLAGDKTGAVESFTKSRATQKWDYDEYQFSTEQLKALAK